MLELDGSSDSDAAVHVRGPGTRLRRSGAVVCGFASRNVDAVRESAIIRDLLPDPGLQEVHLSARSWCEWEIDEGRGAVFEGLPLGGEAVRQSERGRLGDAAHHQLMKSKQVSVDSVALYLVKYSDSYEKTCRKAP